MSIVKEPSKSSLRKVQSRVKMPDAESLGVFSDEERRLLDRLVKDSAECVYSSLFDAPNAEYLFKELPAEGLINPSDDATEALAVLVGPDGTELPIDAERHVFLKFNYGRYRVQSLLKEYRNKRLSLDAARELLTWAQFVADMQNDIVRDNMPLVLAMVKRTRVAGVDYAELISEGNMALMRSVDKFDCARGFKFSTYACRAILKAFARVATRTSRYRGYFPVEFDPTFEKSDHLDRQRDDVEDDCTFELRQVLDSNTAKLNEVEQKVIRHRFAVGIDEDTGKTLEQVGTMIGVTKERVRQIQNKALAKLRSMLEESVLAV